MSLPPGEAKPLKKSPLFITSKKKEGLMITFMSHVNIIKILKKLVKTTSKIHGKNLLFIT
jgi:hypothetical protein